VSQPVGAGEKQENRSFSLSIRYVAKLARACPRFRPILLRKLFWFFTVPWTGHKPTHSVGMLKQPIQIFVHKLAYEQKSASAAFYKSGFATFRLMAL